MSFSKKAICMGISLALLSSTVSAGLFTSKSTYHKDWSSAKSTAEKTFNTSCEKSKKEKKHNDKCEFIKFKQDLGPEIDKLVSGIETYEKKRDEKTKTKVEELLTNLKKTAENYGQLIKAHQDTWKGKISEEPWTGMLSVLEGIKSSALPSVGDQLEKLSKMKITHVDITNAIKKGILQAKVDKIAGALPDNYDIDFFIEGPSTLFDNNPVWEAELVNAVIKAIRDNGGNFKSALEKINKDVADNKYADLKVVTTEIQKAYKDFEAVVAPAAKTAMDAVWNKIVSDKKEYQKYQVKSIVNVASKSVGLIASIAGTVAGGFTGVGTVAGALGMAKTTYTLFNETRQLFSSTETVGKKLHEDITNAQMAINKIIAPSKVALKDRVNKIIEEFGIKSLNNDLNVYQSKLQGYHTKASSLGNQIGQMMEEIPALSKKVAILKQEATTKKIPKLATSANKLEETVSKLEKQLDALLTMTNGLMEIYDKGLKDVEKLKPLIANLNSQEPKWAEITHKFVLPALGVATFAYDIHELPKLLEEVTKNANETVDVLKAIQGGTASVLGGKEVVEEVIIKFLKSN